MQQTIAMDSKAIQSSSMHPKENCLHHQMDLNLWFESCDLTGKLSRMLSIDCSFCKRFNLPLLDFISTVEVNENNLYLSLNSGIL